MLIYIICSVVLFFILGLIWSRDSWLNVFIKLGFFALSFWGAIASNAITVNL